MKNAINKNCVANARDLAILGCVDKDGSASALGDPGVDECLLVDGIAGAKFRIVSDGAVYLRDIELARDVAKRCDDEELATVCDGLLSIIDSGIVPSVMSMKAFGAYAEAGLVSQGDDIQVFCDGNCKIEKSSENQTTRIIITSEHVDRDKDVVSVDGWDFSAFKRNPIVLWAHNSRDLPVGKASRLVSTVADGTRAIAADVEFTPPDIYEFGARVGQMLDAGFLNAASVGFRPVKWEYNEGRKGYDINEAELFEFSIVPLPANPHALTSGASVEEWAAKAYSSANGLDLGKSQEFSLDIETETHDTCDKESDMKRFEINFTDEQFEKLSEGAELRLFVDGDETIITLVEPDPEPETDSGDDEKATEIDIEKFTEVINEAVRDIVTSISLETTGTLPKEA